MMSPHLVSHRHGHVIAGALAVVLIRLAPLQSGPPHAVAGAAAVQPTARTYFVETGGSDNNPGTLTRPFRTIQHAADLVNPGDTVIVGDGIYLGSGANTDCASPTSRPIVCLARGGTADAWVTFRARNKWGAELSGLRNLSTDGFHFLKDANYIRVEGFDIYGIGNPKESSSGFELSDGGHDVVLAKNHLHDIGRLCTDTTNGQVGIFVAQPRVTIVGNVIHDIGRYSPGERGCEPATIYYQNHDHGIYMNGNTVPGASDNVVINNLFYNLSHGWAIQIYPGTVNGFSILNNTFAFSNPDNTGQILLGAASRNGQIINNLFSDPLTAAITFYQGNHTNLVIANNLSTFAIADKSPAGVTFNNNLENVDAQFSPLLFQPIGASPAIDSGMRLSEVKVDINDIPRPQGDGWDIGANEMVRRSEGASLASGRKSQ